LLYQDKVQIPQPTSGDHWNTYNVLSHIIIAGNYPANLSGDWHADIYLKGDKILTEYFSISGGQPPITSEKQYLYNPGKSGEAANKDLDDQGKSNDVAYTTYTTQYNNKGKKNEAIGKADRLNAEGRYDEAIHFYDEAINIDPNNFANWQIWKSKGDALSKQGKYEEAIQAYDKALELAPEISIIYTAKGKALKALGRTNESDVVYATARELGDRSTWVPKTNATPINLTSLFHTEILDHSMASNVDESTNDVITRTSTFSSSDSKIYSWLILGRNLGATVKWRWYSPDGNPYKTGQVDVPRNPSGGYWPSRNVWYYLDTASITTEPYMSGNWHVDIYIGNQKRLTEQFALKMGSGKMEIGPSTEPGSSAAHGTFKVLDHAMASEVDDATNKPVTTTKTHEFKSSMTPYSWLSLGNIGVARIEWYWHNGVQEIRHTYDIPPNPSGGYYPSYNVWDFIDIPGMLQDYELGEIDEGSARESAEIYAESGYYATYSSNPIPDPRGDWTVDIYVNDQWLLQEDFSVFSG